MNDLLYPIDAAVIALALAAAMVAAAVVGAGLGRRWADRHAGASSKPNLNAVETGLLGLLGLMLAFAFSAAAGRSEARSGLMIEAVNAIAATLREIDLYPAGERPALRAELRDYLESRIAFYDAGDDPARLAAAQAASLAAQHRLWAHTVRLAAEPSSRDASSAMLGLQQQMFGIASSRLAALRTHVPDLITATLLVLAVATALTSGYAAGLGRSFSWLPYVGFAALTALVVDVTLDLDRPGRGVIHLDAQQQLLLDLRGQFDAAARTEPDAGGIH